MHRLILIAFLALLSLNGLQSQPTFGTKSFITFDKGDFTIYSKSEQAQLLVSSSNHQISSPGYHTLRIWMIDPGVVIQKIVVNTGGLKPSYLGPPESFNWKLK